VNNDMHNSVNVENFNGKDINYTFIQEAEKKKKLLNIDKPFFNKFFIGRKDELKSLTSALNSSDIIALCGLGGIGKTQIASHYYYFSISNNLYDKFLWIRGNTQELLKTKFINLANKLNVFYNDNTEITTLILDI
jgi:hypothetical protein